MSYFKVKMHQIRFRLGLRPRPRSGSSKRPPARSLSWIWGVLLFRKKRKEGKEIKKRAEREKEEEGQAIPEYKFWLRPSKRL